MGKSKRKISIIGLAGDSDKPYKKYHSKRERMKAKQFLHHGDFELAENQIYRYDHWASCKDGKRFFDKAEHPKLMRK